MKYFIACPPDQGEDYIYRAQEDGTVEIYSDYGGWRRSHRFFSLKMVEASVMVAVPYRYESCSH